MIETEAKSIPNTHEQNKVIHIMTNPNTHIDELNKVIQVMTNHAASILNTHIAELKKVIQVMTNPKIHI